MPFITQNFMQKLINKFFQYLKNKVQFFPQNIFLKSVKKGKLFFEFVDKNHICQIGIESSMLVLLGISGV